MPYPVFSAVSPTVEDSGIVHPSAPPSMTEVIKPHPAINIVLSTPVISSEGKEVTVFAHIHWDGELYCGIPSKRAGDRFEVTLKNKDGNIAPGTMTLHVFTGETDIPYNNSSLTIASKIPPYAHIEYMRNSSGYAHVGLALHECAFRASLLLGGEGRVHAMAVRDTHYFHYLNGLRVLNDLNYYLRLAEALVTKGDGRISKDIGSANLYLPRHVMEDNAKKYGIPDALSVFDTEMSSGKEDIKISEKVMIEAKHHSLTIKVLIAMNKLFGNRKDVPAVTSLYDIDASLEYKRANPSLEFTGTINLLTETTQFIIKEAPFDTPEKEKRLTLIVGGMIIVALAYQDKEYGAQPLYERKMLYPEHSVDELLIINFSVDELVAVGRRALIDKTLPFSVELYAKFFPYLAAIPELTRLFENYLHEDVTATHEASNGASVAGGAGGVAPPARAAISLSKLSIFAASTTVAMEDAKTSSLIA